MKPIQLIVTLDILALRIRQGKYYMTNGDVAISCHRRDGSGSVVLGWR